MEYELLMEQVGRFKGDYPDIPLPQDIDRAALGDVEFVTLPVGKVNAQSRGGRVYSQRAVESLVRQINEMRPEGGWGHMTALDMATRYDPPAIRWLAATLDSDGVAWAKGLPLTEQARSHFKVAKATGSRVGTSIWGPPPTSADGDKVLDFELYRIDIADPTRVGIVETAAKPNLTNEMEGKVPDEMNKDMIAELRAERDAARQELGEIKSKYGALTTTLTGVRGLISEMPYITANVNISESGDNLVDVMRSILQNVANLQANQMIAAIDATVTEMVKLEALRPTVYLALTGATGQPGIAEMVKTKTPVAIIAEMAKASDPAALVKQRVTAILEDSAIKMQAQKLSIAEQGPPWLGAGGSKPVSTDKDRDDLAKRGTELAKQSGMMR